MKKTNKTKVSKKSKLGIKTKIKQTKKIKTKPKEKKAKNVKVSKTSVASKKRKKAMGGGTKIIYKTKKSPIDKFLSMVLVVILITNVYAGVIENNDASGFVTRAEFDSAFSGYQNRMNDYNARINDTVDGAISVALDMFSTSGPHIEDATAAGQYLTSLDTVGGFAWKTAYPPTTKGTSGQFWGTDGTTPAWKTIYPPTSKGSDGQFWGTDGTTPAWKTAYPPTSKGSNGQFWGTNGTTPAWTSLKTSWSSTVANTNIPSEKLVKDTIDTKLDKKGGTSGQYLQSNGTSTDASWTSATATPTKNSGTLFTAGGAYNLQQQIGVIGEVIWYAGKNAPAHFLACQGQDISRTQYSELYNVIGTTYGSGSSTTFKLPQLSDGRFIEGGASSYVGQTRSSQLPNITGSVIAICGGGTRGIFNSASQAFYVSDEHSGAADEDTNGNITRYKQFNFDASRSSSIYQNGVSMVQPPAVIMLACIRYEHG